MKRPKILFLDIETAPTKAYIWGLWGENIGIDQIVEPGYTISFSAKWAGEDKIVHRDIWSHGRKAMLASIYALLNEADMVVHWNGTRFDIPTLNKEFVIEKLKPPAPFIEIDLLPTAKRKFKFQSNKFGFVCKALGIGTKLKHTGFDMWKECLEGDPAAIKLMKEYNIHDTRLLEPVYERFKPWIANHPNVNLYDDDETVRCHACGGTHIQWRGSYATNTQSYRRFQCQDCGAWGKERTNNLSKSKRKSLLSGVR